MKLTLHNDAGEMVNNIQTIGPDDEENWGRVFDTLQFGLDSYDPEQKAVIEFFWSCLKTIQADRGERRQT